MVGPFLFETLGVITMCFLIGMLLISCVITFLFRVFASISCSNNYLAIRKNCVIAPLPAFICSSLLETYEVIIRPVLCKQKEFVSHLDFPINSTMPIRLHFLIGMHFDLYLGINSALVNCFVFCLIRSLYYDLRFCFNLLQQEPIF